MRSPLSQAQAGVYYACETSVSDEFNYQNTALFTLPEDADLVRLQQAVQVALSAHPYLGSHVVVNEEGVPEIESADEGVEFRVERFEVTEEEWKAAQKTFAQTMDVHGEKLYRTEIYTVEGGKSYLYIDLHHVLTDGFSMAVLLREIERVYNGKKPAGEMMDGVAIANEEAAQRADETLMGEARDWYAKTFCDAADTDSLPIPEAIDESQKSKEESRYQFFPLSVTKEEVQAIVKRFGTKESVIMQTAFAQLLATYSAEEKASYCTAFWGRTDRRTLGAITMMVHTLPVFMQTKADTPIADMLSSMEEQLQLTQKYMYYAYPDAVRDLGLNNQVMFVYQGSVLNDKRGLCLGGTMAPHTDLRRPTPGWKLSAELFETADHYALKLGYSTADYSEAFLKQLAEAYSMILRSMVTAERVCELEYCSESQLQWLDARNPKAPKASEGTLVARFKQHVAEQPNAICVVAGDKRLTYAEVDKLSDTLDPQYTERCGEHVIGYSVPRNELMVIVPLSIAKAGMTALPLDSSYPAERLDFMRADAAQYEGGDAFILLYTSGTTGTPKGVMLSEQNILTHTDFHNKHIGLTSESRYATYAGYGFDAFMNDLWGCMVSGAAMYVIGDDIRFDLDAIHEFILREQITHIFMTTQVATQLVQNFPDIPCLQHLGTGGEKLMSLEPPTYRLLNGYGPTESTVYVCSYWVEKKEPNIPIGHSNDTAQLFIVNKYGKRVPWGAAGELLVAGPQVGLGYLNQPQKTADVFVEWDGKRVYRTGDIVRYRYDGEIEFVGRKDGQVKIRGFRIELKEVEAVIRQFDGIKDATVQAFDYPSGGKFIAAYIVSDQKVDIQALNAFIMDQKPPYMVPAVTMQIDAIPLNQNQKVNKRALPEPKAQTDDTPKEAAPLNVLEEQLTDIVGGIINNRDFGITTDLRYVGLSSISAIKLATQVYKRFGVQLDAKMLVKGANIQTIENEILMAMLGGNRDTVIPESRSTDNDLTVPFPLSHAQTGVYFECMKNPTSTLYNIPMRARLPLEIDDEALRAAVTQVVNNHPELFVHFRTNDIGVEQVVDKSLEFRVESLEKKEDELDAYRAEFVRPFNLSKDLLCRFSIVRTEQALYLYCDMHHLVCDGASYDVFFNELCTLLDGGTIDKEMCSYAQFVADEQAAEKGEEYAAAKDFFHSQLAQVEGATEVPADLSNPKDGEIGQVYAPMDIKAAEALSQKAGVTPAGVTLAAVFYTLARFANTDDLCITTISNGRSNLKMANTIGMMVNTLALSSKISDQTVEAFIRETGEHFEQTLAHENYPFAQIAADYDLTAEIMFAYQLGVLSEYKVNGQAIATENMELNVPKFKISFYIIEVHGQPSVAIEYDNGRYSEGMMQSLAQAISNAISAFVAVPTAPIQSVCLTDKAQIQLLDSFNQTEVPYDTTETIVSQFRRQAQLTPDSLAVVYHENKYTYHEVDDLTERIASLLNSKGLGKEDVVSILIPRCEWMPIAALGVLKAGSAYQPLDPSYPAERLNFMIQDASAKMLIADASLRGIVSEYQGEVLLTKDIFDLPKAVKPVDVTVDPTNLFILLYTSGSTGTPKGCQLEHRNLAAFCHWYKRRFELKAEHHVSCYASYGFDCCMMDMYPALTCGACVYIIGDDIRLNLPDVNAYFNENHITHSFMTTQVAYQFAVNMDNHSLQHLIAAGEKLTSLVPPKNYKLHNGYGPTEGTILITEFEVDKELKDIPVGTPLDNSRLYIVDKHFNRLPQGALGELWISGAHVTRGYLNRPEKTAEVYISNPFSDDPKYSRIYRTGDMVRYLPDGNIQFVGRRDGQVKIRGFRIELKEVEAIIRQFPGIKDATVQAFDYPNGGKFIAAYIVGDKKIDIAALNAFIKESKPSYMVPAATMQIDVIPLNQNQKVNKRALPTPVMQASDCEYVAPVNDSEKLFCDIYASVLTMDKVGATDNFFQLGGTSLMVTRVIIEADKAGKHIAYADLFSHPSPRELANLVDGREVANKSETVDYEITEFDYSAINELLQANSLESFKAGERQELGNVLLTGATGYLGIHVLKELIDSDAKTITCLVRGKSQEDAERRVRNLLFYYFSRRFDELFGTRIFVLQGDVTSDFNIQAPINMVFNCAANVKHFSKGTDIEDVNIGGAQRCVDFCLATGAALVHVSTTSTGGVWIGNNLPAPVLTERNIWFGQYLGNQYMHSKFLADRLILDAVATKGLRAKVMRVGNLAARSYDGEFQVNFSTNSYMGRIKIFNMLGCCPFDMYDQPTEFSPINETARAIVLLATTPKECTVFQPYNTHTRLLGNVLQVLDKLGTKMQFVEPEAFGMAVQQAALDPNKAPLLTTMLAYQNIAHGQPTQIVDRNNAYTSQVLLRLGFQWTEPDNEYIGRMLTAISQLGFFDV